MRQRERFVAFAPFVDWSNGLSPWFEKKKANKKSEEVSRDIVAKKRKKNK